MEYFNKFRSTVNQVATQVSNALPGNPLTREYDVGDQIGTAGLGLYWKVYKGTKKTTKQAVSVWLFDKKDIERWPKDDRENFLTLIKRGVSQLTRLRHPRLLVIEHPIEESRDSLAFATEPVFASLANCLGCVENMPLPNPVHLAGFTLLDVEIKHGLLQIAEALAFLHIDASMLHRNICPESIIINEKGAWKLGGFDFSVSGTKNAENQLAFEMFNWDERNPSVCQPSLDYFAPEYVVSNQCSVYSDMYSMGALSFAVYNKCKPPMEHKSSLPKFKKNVEQLKSLPSHFADNIPSVFREDFKMCLNPTAYLRPDATQFTKIAYFDDPLVKALNYFESLMQMDNNQKMQFFKSLPAVLNKFDKRPLLQKVLPYLSGEFGTPDLIPFILPSIFLIAEQASKKEFSSVIMPQLIPVFSMERPYQIALLLLQRMELLLEKATEEDVKKYVLPLVYNAISSETTRIQELCLSIVPTIGKLVDRSSMKTQLLPKLLKLATDGGVLAIRVQSLVCIGKLIPTLESWMVSEQVLPTLPKITSKEPGILMAILGIYKLSFDNEAILVGKEQWARSALPFLMASSVENTLNLGQFEQYMVLIKAMLARVEKEHRTRLVQLSAGQEDQRSVPNFDEVIRSSSSNDLPKSLDGLGDIMSTQNGSKGDTAKSTGVLSLEEKKRLAAEQEYGRQMKGQTALQAGSTQPPKFKSPTPTPMSAFGTSSNSSSTASIPAFADFSKPFGSTAASSSKPTSAFDALFDPLQPTTTVSSSKGKVDLSDFMPTTNSAAPKPVPPMANFSQPMVFPSAGAFATGPQSIEQQLGGLSFAGGVTPMGLPQPPRSSNAAVQRGGQPTSSLDTLLSFPQKDNRPMSAMQQQPGIRPPQTAQKQPQKSSGIDPFSDLLG